MATPFIKRKAFCIKYNVNENIWIATLRTQGLLQEIITCSEYTDLGWKVKKRTIVPTEKALDKFIAKRARNSKGASKGSSYEWNEPYLGKVFSVPPR
jgi:hypothetical protein